jgi:hypothetical protein
MHALKCLLTATLGITLSFTAAADKEQFSGFLGDYSDLQQSSDAYAGYFYLAPNAPSKVKKYDAVMIDQPELFIADDSKYKGIKPDDMKALADGLRQALAAEISRDYHVVDVAGPNVLYLRLAATNLYLKEKKRGLFGYTPIGLVAGAVKSAVADDIANKVSLKGVTVEMEILDSETGERLVAMVERRAGTKEDAASWQELEMIFTEYGKRVQCRLSNAKLPKNKWVACRSKS